MKQIMKEQAREQRLLDTRISDLCRALKIKKPDYRFYYLKPQSKIKGITIINSGKISVGLHKGCNEYAAAAEAGHVAHNQATRLFKSTYTDCFGEVFDYLSQYRLALAKADNRKLRELMPAFKNSGNMAFNSKFWLNLSRDKWLKENHTYLLGWAIANAAVRKYGDEIDRFLFKLSRYKCKIDKYKFDPTDALIMKGDTLKTLFTYSKPERERIFRNMMYHIPELNLFFCLTRS